MLTEASSSEHESKSEVEFTLNEKKFHKISLLFVVGKKEMSTPSIAAEKKYYEQKVILRLRKCPISRRITDSV